MSDNKQYYYLKLKDNFFDSEEIKILESMDNGYKYSNILLKMYLKSLKRDGLLVFKEKIPYNPKMIATVTNHNINDVKQALNLFNEMDLIEILSDGAIYMMDIQNFIGQSTSEADRIRSYRNKIEQRKEELLNKKLKVSTNVQQKNNLSTPELEIELEIEKELDKQQKNEKVFVHWQSKEQLHKHKTVTKTIKKQLDALSKKKADEVIVAIDRYHMAYVDKNYFYEHKWTLDKFIKQGNGYQEWLDDGQRWVDYSSRKSKSREVVDF